MEQSILNSTKKILGIAPDYEVFDQDVLTFINTAFSAVSQIGVGPSEGLFIQDDTVGWGAFDAPLNQLNMVKTYVYLRVRLAFDPPATSFLIESANAQLREYEWRLNSFAEQVTIDAALAALEEEDPDE